jgi:hypothetical protein
MCCLIIKFNEKYNWITACTSIVHCLLVPDIHWRTTKARSGIMNGWSTTECGDLETTNHPPSECFTCEGINNKQTNKQKTLCRIGMERPYGTVCETCEVCQRRPIIISQTLFLSHCRVIRRLKRTRLVFLRPSHSDRFDLSAGHPSASTTVAYGQDHEVLLFPFYGYGITSP